MFSLETTHRNQTQKTQDFLNQICVDRFIFDLDNKTSATKESYRRCLNAFFAWANSKPSFELSERTIKEYKLYLHDKGLSPYSISLYLTSLRLFLNYYVSQGLLAENPAKNIKNPKLYKGHSRDSLSIEEAHKLLNSIDRTTLIGKRDYCMIYLMLKTGLREIELFRANTGDLRPKDNRIVLYIRGKGCLAKNEFVILSDEVYNAILDYKDIKQYNNFDPLFTGIGNRSKARLTTRAIRQRINCYLKKAGIKRPTLTAHSLRHTAACLALHAGAPLFEVKRMLRHHQIATTMVYLHEVNRVQNAAENYIKQI